MNITQKPSPNYWEGRTHDITEVVVHWMDGTLAATDAHFASESTQVSAHYGIEDDNVHQYVSEDDTAWHARQANPWTIGIEHSAQPGRDATEKTYQTSITLCADICKRRKLDPMTAIVPHSKYVATQCPGTIDIAKIRAGAKALIDGGNIPLQAPQPITPSVPPVQGAKQLYLPGAATSWRIYALGTSPVIGNEIGYLNPSLFGGLTYDIQDTTRENTYVIQTRDYGKVQIYAGPETGATVVGTNNISAAPVAKVSNTATVRLPASADTWRVYPLDKAPVVGNEIGMLKPSQFNGLTYEVLGTPQAHVVTIQTRDYGRVNIYVGSETGAIIN